LVLNTAALRRRAVYLLGRLRPLCRVATLHQD
jgi:hypothetical protein